MGFGNEIHDDLHVSNATERHLVSIVGREQLKMLHVADAKHSHLRKVDLPAGGRLSRAAPAKDPVAQPAFTVNRTEPLGSVFQRRYAKTQRPPTGPISSHRIANSKLIRELPNHDRSDTKHGKDDSPDGSASGPAWIKKLSIHREAPFDAKETYPCCSLGGVSKN